MSNPGGTPGDPAAASMASVMIWRSDPTMGCDYFNDSWLVFTGRSLEQELGHGWAQGVHPDDLVRCLKTYRHAFTRREPFEMEYRLRRSDGTYRWIHDHGEPFRNPAGEFAGYIGSCAEIAEDLAVPASPEPDAEAGRLRRGLRHVCAWCRKVRDADGHWRKPEPPAARPTTGNLSHGICPTCSRQFLIGLPEAPSLSADGSGAP